MKTKMMIVLLALTCTQAFPGSGSTVGNGFTTESVLKSSSLKKSKNAESLCTDLKNAKIVKIKGEDHCVISDGKTTLEIKLKELKEAAEKNDKSDKSATK